MIREATPADIPRIIEMGRKFLLSGPYRDIMPDNPEVATSLAEKLVAYPEAKVLVAEEEGKVIGVFAFVVFPHYYSGLSTAGELIWYILPEHRRMTSFTDSPALNLLNEAEKLAKEMGAVQMHLTAPTIEIGSLYKRRGYKQVEIGFQREL